MRQIEDRRLHQVLYGIIRAVVRPFMRHRYNTALQNVAPKSSPCIVLANHTTNEDPILMGMAFPHMYFVASEQLFRMGILTRLLLWACAPILRLKTRTEMRTAMEVLRVLRSGANVCLFAEGTNSWNGVNCEIPPATSKMVKKSGASLITYRIEGGFLSHARWQKGVRRGKITGTLVGEYSPEQIAQMSNEELYAQICSDLYVNAYEVNARERVRFIGKNKAEAIETALYLCPRCHRFGTIHSHGDRFGCDCGLELVYNDYGLFETVDGSEPPFRNMLEWDRWQEAWVKDRLSDLRRQPADVPITSDDDQLLYQYEVAGKTRLIARGRFTLYNDRMAMTDRRTGCTTVFPLSEVSGIACITSMRMPFTCRDRQYELTSPHPRSALKYARLCGQLSDMRVMI